MGGLLYTDYESQYISLRMVGIGETVVVIPIRRRSPFRNLMIDFSHQMGIPLPFLEFRYQGRTILETDRPIGLGLGDGAFIQVLHNESLNGH